MIVKPTQLNFAKQVIFTQISKNLLLLEISKSYHFRTVIFLLEQGFYFDFILILAKETVFFECKILPCIFRPIWPKIKISIKVIKYSYVGFIWDLKFKILFNKLNGYTFMSQMFDIFMIFTSFDFRESAEFNKNKGW